MDAIGAHAPEPDDRYMFDSIVANLDIDEAGIEQAATEPEPAPAAAPATVTPEPALAATTAPEPAPKPTSDQERTVVPTAPEPAASPPPATADLLAPPKPPELVVPPKPQRPDSGVVNWWAKAFPHIVWLSVIAGLAGQIFGFAEFFGGGPVAWIIASVLGGTFEFMMVACSSRGLRAIGLGRSWREFTPFLLLGTAAAGFAAYMNVNHFAGWLGLAAGTVSLLGYAAHVFSHLYEELEHRKDLAEWEAEKAKVEAEIKARADADRAEYDAYRAEIAQHRRDVTRKLATASAPSPAPAQPAPADTDSAKPASKTSGRPTAKKPGKPELDRATALDWVATSAPDAGPAAVRQHFTAKGFEVPTDRTLRRWLNENEDATK